MRWFRKSDETAAPRLISLSPLTGGDAELGRALTAASPGPPAYPSAYPAAMMSHSRSQWSFHSTLDLDLPDDDARLRSSDSTSHLPCTLKRKPAVRRRIAGGQTRVKFWPIIS